MLLKGAVIALQLAVGTFVTVVDQVAWILHQGAQHVETMKERVTSLMSRILQFLGRAVAVVKDLTVSFIRWVLLLLFSFLSNSVQRAVDRLFA